jgi:hypothetical protein
MFFVTNILTDFQVIPQTSRKQPQKPPTRTVDKMLHRTRRPGTFNPPSKFTKTDIWGPKFKPRKTLVHAKKRRISNSTTILFNN